MEQIIGISLLIVIVVFLLILITSKFKKNKKTVIPPLISEPRPEIEKPSEHYFHEISETQSEPKSDDFLSNEVKNIFEKAIIVDYANTCTESEYYKDKLKDDNWKKKSKEIKKRDGFKCQLCSSSGDDLIELENIDDIIYYVDFPDVADIVKTVFNNREKYIEEIEHIWVAQNDSDKFDLNHFLHASSCLPNEKTEFYTEYEIFKIPVTWIYDDFIWDFKHLKRYILTKNNVETP